MHTSLKNIFILNITILFSIATTYAADPQGPAKDEAPANPDKKNTIQTWTAWGKEYVHWGISVAAFIPTIHANDYMGQGPCTFHAMLEPFDPKKTQPHIIFNENDEITAIYDAKKGLLILSNIPRSPDHFKKMREFYHLPDDAPIGLHTLNRKFEQKYVWLKTSIKQDGHVKQYRYDTTDFTAPSQIDLIRAIFEIDTRDWKGEDITDVHCKAGKGRSGTVIIAYYGSIYYKGQKIYENGTPYTKTFTPEELTEKLIAYGKKKRYLININGNQKPALYEFFGNFQKAGDIQSLYIQNTEAIAKRENELKPKQ